MMGSMTAHAAIQQMNDAELSEVGGQFNLISGINSSIPGDSIIAGANPFGSRSLASEINFAALSGTLDNHMGLAGAHI